MLFRNSTFIGATIYMLIVQYWSRNVTAKWDNLHKSKEQVASLLRRSYAISPPVPTNRRIRKYKTEHLPKCETQSSKSSIYIYIHCILSRCLLSLRWLCRIPIGGSIGLRHTNHQHARHGLFTFQAFLHKQPHGQNT